MIDILKCFSGASPLSSCLLLRFSWRDDKHSQKHLNKSRDIVSLQGPSVRSKRRRRSFTQIPTIKNRVSLSRSKLLAINLPARSLARHSQPSRQLWGLHFELIERKLNLTSYFSYFLSLPFTRRLFHSQTAKNFRFLNSQPLRWFFIRWRLYLIIYFNYALGAFCLFSRLRT